MTRNHTFDLHCQMLHRPSLAAQGDKLQLVNQHIVTNLEMVGNDTLCANQMTRFLFEGATPLSSPPLFPPRLLLSPPSSKAAL